MIKQAKMAGVSGVDFGEAKNPAPALDRGQYVIVANEEFGPQWHKILRVRAQEITSAHCNSTWVIRDSRPGDLHFIGKTKRAGVAAWLEMKHADAAE